MSKHTEGEWLAMHDRGFGNETYTVYSRSGSVLAEGVTEANAARIVLAVNSHDEMLDALKDIATHPLRMVKYEEWALAAIEKAEAES